MDRRDILTLKCVEILQRCAHRFRVLAHGAAIFLGDCDVVRAGIAQQLSDVEPFGVERLLQRSRLPFRADDVEVCF